MKQIYSITIHKDEINSLSDMKDALKAKYGSLDKACIEANVSYVKASQLFNGSRKLSNNQDLLLDLSLLLGIEAAQILDNE